MLKCYMTCAKVFQGYLMEIYVVSWQQHCSQNISMQNHIAGALRSVWIMIDGEIIIYFWNSSVKLTYIYLSYHAINNYVNLKEFSQCCNFINKKLNVVAEKSLFQKICIWKILLIPKVGNIKKYYYFGLFLTTFSQFIMQNI